MSKIARQIDISGGHVDPLDTYLAYVDFLPLFRHIVATCRRYRRIRAYRSICGLPLDISVRPDRFDYV